jgi:hypothetical protein
MTTEPMTETQSALVAEAVRVASLLGRACGELTFRAAAIRGEYGEWEGSAEPFPGADILHSGAIDFGPEEAEASDMVCDAALDAFLTAHDGRVGEMLSVRGPWPAGGAR